MRHALEEASLGSIDTVHLLWAVLLGGLSAVSLPLGSALGLTLRPGATLTGTLAAFGAGALIAALSVEIVAPVVEAFHHDPTSRDALITLMVGGAAGGVLFVVLDQIVNAQGGFLRKTATTIGHLRRTKRRRAREILADLAPVELLRNVPPDEIGEHVEDLYPVLFHDGEILFREGERGDRLYFVRRGEVVLEHRGAPLATLGPGDVVGEIALVTDSPRTATGRARGVVQALALQRSDFDRWRKECPELDAAARELAHTRLARLREHDADRNAEADRWMDEAIEALRFGTELPTAAEIREAGEAHGGAPLAIWLGILLDGIPESVVIGDSFHERLHTAQSAGEIPGFLALIPYTLVAGLFLSNFPEAMSSSVGMRGQGFHRGRILFLWSTLVVVTGLGSGLGFALGAALPEATQAGIQGVAAGAMLTMIASTMIPEAVHLGGRNVVGLSTLAGFFAAVGFALLG
ncbi:MAG: cyclic nucleotide-binding domain-containing protein [Myxococcales bacterium]|nr:cyclic nucleotide-binding domain-containing protein [Myxococcales bacterium]